MKQILLTAASWHCVVNNFLHEREREKCTHGGYLEAASMITVLDAGIQDALNFILVQTSGLEPIPHGISIGAYAKQCKD